MRVWSVADGRLVRTIWVPVGPEPIGSISTVAISPDGSTIAAGGDTEVDSDNSPVYLFDLKSGAMVRRIVGDCLRRCFLTFSPDGRYLAATLEDGRASGLRSQQELAPSRSRRPGRRRRPQLRSVLRARRPSGDDLVQRPRDHSSLRSEDQLLRGPIKAPSGRIAVSSSLQPGRPDIGGRLRGRRLSRRPVRRAHSALAWASPRFSARPSFRRTERSRVVARRKHAVRRRPRRSGPVSSFAGNGRSLRTFRNCAADIAAGESEPCAGDRILVCDRLALPQLDDRVGRGDLERPLPIADFRPLRTP